MKPNGIPKDPKTLGEHLKARRLTLDLYQRDVALLLQVSKETVLHWELDQTTPPIRAIPAIRAFLGYDPYPAPTTLPERLKAWRMTRGMSVKRAAACAGIDESTWGGWERGQAPIGRHRPLLDRLLG